MLFRASETAPTPALGPHTGTPSSAFSATFSRVRRIAIPFATLDRVMPLSGPVVLDGGGDCVAPAVGLSAEGEVIPLGAVCPTLTTGVAALEATVCNMTGLDDDPSGLEGRFEDDGVWLGVARVKGAGLGLLDCERERGLRYFSNFFFTLFFQGVGEDIVKSKYNEQSKEQGQCLCRTSREEGVRKRLSSSCSSPASGLRSARPSFSTFSSPSPAGLVFHLLFPAAMVSLPTSSAQPTRGRGLARRVLKGVMRSRRVRIPKYDMPIRLRPVRLPCLAFRMSSALLTLSSRLL
jgi:hypothetical protein